MCLYVFMCVYICTQAFLEENVTHSAKSIKAEQHIQKVLNLVKKKTFWEFRVDYLKELGGRNSQKLASSPDLKKKRKMCGFTDS
jgi:hypothetical protein